MALKHVEKKRIEKIGVERESERKRDKKWRAVVFSGITYLLTQ